eukprot:797536-Pleurochrysis_carterae.AAC.4
MTTVIKAPPAEQRSCSRAGLGGVDREGGRRVDAACRAEAAGEGGIHVKFGGVVGSAIVYVRARGYLAALTDVDACVFSSPTCA